MARLSRGQSLTASKKKIEYFSDFTNSFTITPIGDQLAKTTNENSIKQALKNLIFTIPGERPFNPNFGSYITNLLFENNIKENLSIAEEYVRTAVNNFEPRVQLENVVIESSINNEHEVYVTLTYFIINNEEPQKLTFLLKRVR